MEDRIKLLYPMKMRVLGMSNEKRSKYPKKRRSMGMEDRIKLLYPVKIEVLGIGDEE